MSKKAIIAVVAALVLGIGGTVAYFYLHSLYVANTAPPVAATQQGSAVPPAANQGRYRQPVIRLYRQPVGGRHQLPEH